MDTALIAVFVILGALGLYLKLVGWDKMLFSSVRGRIHAGEELRYAAAVHRTSDTSIFSWLSMREGVVLVTDTRFIFANWVLPPFWKTIKAYQLQDVQIENFHKSNIPRSELIVSGERMVLQEKPNLAWLSRYPDSQLIDAIEGGKKT